MTSVVHVLPVLGSMHLGADWGRRYMIVVPHLHMMILLEWFEVLRTWDLVRKALLIASEGHLHVYQLLLLLEAESVHGRLLRSLAKPQSLHGGVEAGLRIVKSGELKVWFEVEELGEVIVADIR